MPNEQPPHEHRQGTALALLPLIAAVALGLTFIGVMLAMMAWWGGDHLGMMRRGSAGTDQTPIASDSKQVTVEMRDFEFFPAKLTVNAGSEITWLNRDDAPHNAIADDGSFDTGTLNRDDSSSVVLDRPGTYPYVCTFHPGMEATLTVR